MTHQYTTIPTSLYNHISSRIFYFLFAKRTIYLFLIRTRRHESLILCLSGKPTIKNLYLFIYLPTSLPSPERPVFPLLQDTVQIPITSMQSMQRTFYLYNYLQNSNALDYPLSLSTVLLLSPEYVLDTSPFYLPC